MPWPTFFGSRVGLKAGTGNEEMRNEETEKWGNGEMGEMVTILRTEPWVIY